MSENGFPKVITDDGLISLRSDHLLGVTFGKSSSSSYRKAVKIAKQASIYREVMIDGETLHVVVFSRTLKDVLQAKALLWIISKWKSTLVHVGQKTVDPSDAWSTVWCFSESLECTDTKAHCVYRQPVLGGFLEYSISLDGVRALNRGVDFLPCRRVAGQKIDPNHPSSRADQIQAHAVRLGCDWCPNFNMGNYRWVPPGSP